MPRLRPFLSSCVLPFALALLSPSLTGSAAAQEAPSPDAAPSSQAQPQQQPPERQDQPPAPITREDPQPLSQYNKALFEKPFDPAQLAFLSSAAGGSSGDLFRDRQFRKLMKAFVPDCMFHYGRDMPLSDALDAVLSGAHDPVILRDGRYLMLSGARGPYLSGRAFLWLDLQDGIGLGAFFFTPTNGEPSPTVAVFSRQVKTNLLAMSDMPPAFAGDLAQWSMHASVPEITTRYFLNGANKRILLEHDENYCALGDGTVAPPDSGCEQLNANAADLDETAAYYLAQVHYATNATAWMLGPDQIAWVGVRDRSCLGIADPLGCRIRLTRQHTHILINRPMPHPIRR